MPETKIYRVHRDVVEALPRLYRILCDEMIRRGEVIVIEDEQQQPGRERAAV